MESQKSLTNNDNSMNNTVAEKDDDKSGQDNSSQVGDEYDDSWDHIYDENVFENRKRRLDRSEKNKYNKQEW
jgi:hypothetical protein